MILCCAYALRLLKQNEQLKKKHRKQTNENKRKGTLKNHCFYDVSGLKNVFNCLLQARENSPCFCLLSFASIVIHLL